MVYIKKKYIFVIINLNPNSMRDYQRVLDRNDFEMLISDVLSEYLDNKSLYEGEVFLQINPQSLKVEFCEVKSNSTEEINPVYVFFRKSDNNELEIDCDATYDLASKYVFIG